LDVGDKTIGVALSDELEITARGLFTLERVSDKKDAGKLLTLVEEHGCGAVVIGLPINLNGSDSKQTLKVRTFAVRMENMLRSNGKSNVPVILHDERFTTKIAEKVLIEANMSREKRRTIIDKQAAVVILQSYLSSRHNRNGARNDEEYR
jgi:putative Holliday junction resolvase